MTQDMYPDILANCVLCLGDALVLLLPFYSHDMGNPRGTGNRCYLRDDFLRPNPGMQF